MGDFGSRDNVGFSDGLESVDSECVAFTDLHNLIVSSEMARWVLTFPKLPLPITFSNSNESIVSGVYLSACFFTTDNLCSPELA